MRIRLQQRNPECTGETSQKKAEKPWAFVTECDWIGSKFEDVENWQCLPRGTFGDLVGKHRKPP